MREIESSLLQLTSEGLYCPAGGFHIDPGKPVPLAVVTHAHSDHARPGCGEYITSASGAGLLRLRVGKGTAIRALGFQEPLKIGAVRLSLHPAGHILGSAQVRVEHEGRVLVVTGDYNCSQTHPAAEPFETVKCDILVTESTFGLPVYQWPPVETVMEEIRDWWAENRRQGRTSVLPCYPLGKTQRILAALDGSDGPVALAGPGRDFLPFYREAGVRFPDVHDLNPETVPLLKGRGLLIHSSAGKEPALLRELEPVSMGSVSGWLQLRSFRRSRGSDRGFVLSDHADWNGLLRCVRESGARKVGVAHGQTEVLARYLAEEMGLDTFVVPGR